MADPIDTEALRREHEDDGDGFCWGCEALTDWPCSTLALLDEIDRLRAERAVLRAGRNDALAELTEERRTIARLTTEAAAEPWTTTDPEGRRWRVERSCDCTISAGSQIDPRIHPHRLIPLDPEGDNQ